ncbi:MAG: sulfatase-like hydrolase/transferase, partial [Balneolales bacterium]
MSACNIEPAEEVVSLDGCTTGSMNIVLYVSDDHGQDTGAYGNDVIQTPNLDAMAAEGVLFKNAYATTASCSASRSVILSGLHNHRNG